MTPITCSFPDCALPPKTRGYCGGHYQQWKAGRGMRPLQDRVRREAGGVCSFQGCLEPRICKGFCDGHYQQHRLGKEMAPLHERHTTCMFPGCENKHDAKGLCSGHYAQKTSGCFLRPLRDTPSPLHHDGESWCVTLYGKSDGHIGKEVGFARVSDEDRSLVEQHRWRRSDGGYATTKVDGQTIQMHRLLLGLSDPSVEGDHIDGDRLNNRRPNLRAVSHAENMQNRRSAGKSGVRGVFLDKETGLYRVIVVRDKRRFDGGRFASIEEADAKASALRLSLHTHTNEKRRKERS